MCFRLWIKCFLASFIVSVQQQLSHLSQVFRVGYINQKRITPNRAHGSAFSTHFYRAIILSLSPLAFISCRTTSIHIFFGLSFALLTCPKLISYTRWTGASVNLHHTWLNHRRRFSLIFSSTGVTHILVRIFLFLTLPFLVLHTSNKVCASLLHSSSGYDIFL